MWTNIKCIIQILEDQKNNWKFAKNWIWPNFKPKKASLFKFWHAAPLPQRGI